MILLDLNLPKVDGAEVLAEVQLDPVLKDIPLVVLTSSKLDHNMLKQFRIAADCFIMKPLTLESYLQAVKCFPHLGVSIVNLGSAPDRTHLLY
jgi:Response regulator containing a CheY-like receiver domain and a GGDEF domain